MRGGIAIQLLGATLFFLLLVGGLGLLESRRALAARTEAQRALQAALQSAAASPTPAETFQWYLTQNLRGQPFQANLHRLAPGEADPLTGATLSRPLLTAQLSLPYQITWLGRGTEVTLRLSAAVWQEE
ncbi:MAG TPA: hypothetical protein VK191_14820 [Symbiobacteriaceae bacterium]|nr:hypothetical protein [Symbiobacteriaceae bacterium]